MIKLFLSEWLRTKRTPIRWFTFCLPVVFSLLIVAYLAVRGGATEAFVYEGFFTVYTVFVLPVAVGILAGFLVQEEELAGQFNGFLSMKLSRRRLYLGKFMMLLFCFLVCIIVSIGILCLGLWVMMPQTINVSSFLWGGILMFAGALPLMALHLWLAFAWGTGASIGMGMAGILLAALMGMFSMGGEIWYMIPYAWPVKLAMLPGTKMIEGSAGLSVTQIREAVVQTGAISLSAALTGTAVFFIGGIVWFSKWEGRKSYE